MGFIRMGDAGRALDYYGPMTPFKRFKTPTLLLALALAWPLVRAEDEVPKNSALSASMMYELLLAEISAYNEDSGSAFQLMMDAARKDRSDQLYQRAVEIALQARAGDSALQAAQAWSRNLPASKDANRYLLQILIGLNKLGETVEPLKREIAGVPPKERAAAIGQLPRYFVRATDKKLASQVLEQALAGELGSRSNGPAAFAAIGALRVLAEDASGALEAVRKGMALNPKAEEPVQLALALLDAKLPAAEQLVQAHLQQGARPEIHMLYVRKLLEAQRYDDAYKQTLLICSAAPNFSEAWLVRGSLALQNKRLPEAQTSLDTYLQLRQAELKAIAADASSAAASEAEAETDRGLVQAYFLLSDLAELQQRPADAERYLGLIDSPQDALRVRSRRAAMLARQGKLDEGRALIRSTPETVAEDARNKITAEVQLLRDNKQFGLVYQFLTEASQSFPADIDLRYDLAMAAERVDKLEEMEKLLRQVIAEKPDYLHAYNALGYSLADRNMRLPEARVLITKALDFAPNDPFIQDSLGWVEFRSGHLNDALRILRSAYENRQDAEIAAHLGEVLWTMGMQDQARTIWKSGLEQSPDNDTLLQTIKRLGSL